MEDYYHFVNLVMMNINGHPELVSLLSGKRFLKKNKG